MSDLQRKALYNLIQLNLKPGTEATLLDGTILEPWQAENYREWSTTKLIDKLHELKIRLEMNDFHAYAQNYDNPEEMADSLTGDMDLKSQDRVYLIFFELWRRILPNKQSLSLFCDELDYQIILYDKGETKNPSDIQDAIAYLQNLLDENVDEGVQPEEAFQLTQTYCANDLESFLYDYTLEELEAGNETYASELIEGFFRYLSEPLWFEFLKIRLNLLNENEQAISRLHHFVEELIEENHPQLNLEILQLLAKRRDKNLFIPLALKTSKLIDTEEDLNDYMTICQTFFHEIDQPASEKIIQESIEKRPLKKLSDAVIFSDPDLVKVRELLKKNVI